MPGPAVRPLHAQPSPPPLHRAAGSLLGRVIGDRCRIIAVFDFGIAEIEGQGPVGGLGTPTYLSPEQALGGAPDARSDPYSLGAMLYEAGGRAPAPRGRRPHGALAKRPEDRFSSWDEMRAALQATAEVSATRRGPGR